MIEKIVFIDNDDIIKICTAWRIAGDDVAVIARIAKMDQRYVVDEVSRLKELGILKDNKELDEHVEKYIQTIVGGRIKSLQSSAK